ncbi:long-chain fatty acid--CoA ligase [Caballeronia mineralivorans PML1(12)]|uniref:Long-chain fatty acid--CoA ligase n=1 Tax=Caballeronia mineralivorans PML1(12) TaxID=908627 RepID=A0A0J1CU84_9BURK|nr:AMP-binding protein [Caballeronia mineralivorans]KLU23891.1 long-chain fatty acid--CoA ligase [Caballeronia mineralivorans PML1(12)]
MYPIDFFWRATRRWPTRIAIDAPDGAVRYDELGQQVAALAAAFQEIDPNLQSRVGICAGNSTEHLIALLAVLASGKVWVPLNPRSTQPEIQRIVDTTQPTILVVDTAYVDLVADATASRILCQGYGDHANPSERREENQKALEPRLHDLVAAYAGWSPRRFDLPGNATQAIKFTGGTTGTPKGVMQPYRAWMANVTNQIQAWRFDEHDRYIVGAPITHGTSTYILPILAQGGCHVILPEAGAQAVRNAFRDRAGTVSFMPPTLVYMLMALPGISRGDFPNLRRLIYGGAAMPSEKIREVRAFFGPVLGTTYGQTEAPQILTVMRPEDFEDPQRWSSVGATTWFSDVAIMSPEGRLLPPGEVGEVVARGDLLMTGYWNLPEKTAETLIDGWLHTGDRGFIDESGFLYLKDRIRDLVITGGFNVYPVDVENALGQHPAVHECTVFGIPDDKWGEAVQAAVQLRAGMVVTEAELSAFVREKLGPVHTPKHVHFYDDLPRSSIGKVLKNAVREDVLSNIASHVDA